MTLRRIGLCCLMGFFFYSEAIGQLLSSVYNNSADITVDNSMVSGSTDLNNFVLLIALEANSSTTDSDVLSNGYDIVFAPNSSSMVGSEYKHDLESYNGTTGELIIWVQVDLSASVDTEFTMFYGQSGVVTDPSDPTLWTDANYIGVWQLSETPGTNAIVDAAGNSANGSSFGDVSVDASSVVGQGYSFDGAGDYVLIDESIYTEPTGSFTISCWFKTAGVQNNYAKMFAKGETGFPYGSYTLEMRPNGVNHDQEVGFQTGREAPGANFVLTDSNGNGVDDITTGEWNFFAGVIDDAGGPDITQRFYLNGDLISSSTDNNTQAIDYYTGTYELAIGGIYNGGINNEFQGTIDELRIANVVRSEDYLRTEVRNTACVSNYMTIAGISGLTCTDVTLPVVFKEFNAQKSVHEVTLNWVTASEENNDYFTVEKSTDGKSFRALSNIDGAGNSNSLLHYQYVDRAVNNQMVFYRIKQTDFDGSFKYSKVEKVLGQAQNSAQFSVFPNPSLDNRFTLNISGMGEGAALVYVRNLSGQILHRVIVKPQTNADRIQEELHLDDLAKGTYILNVIGKNASFTEKLIVQ